MEKISEHISYTEATKSMTAIRLGIDNTPNSTELARMKIVAEELFEPIRKHFAKPIKVTSFFRSEDLNTALKGSSTSQHRMGEAIDIDGQPYGIKNKDILEFVLSNGIVFDQMIYEFGNDDDCDWLHISKIESGNRRQVLRAYRDGSGRTKYKGYDL